MFPYISTNHHEYRIYKCLFHRNEFIRTAAKTVLGKIEKYVRLLQVGDDELLAPRRVLAPSSE